MTRIQRLSDDRTQLRNRYDRGAISDFRGTTCRSLRRTTPGWNQADFDAFSEASKRQARASNRTGEWRVAGVEE